MKLIDILVEELPKRGGWQEGRNYAWQDETGEIRFDTEIDCDFFPQERMLCEKRRPIGKIFIDVSDSFIVTREQYEAALAAKNDGWIEWGGGECPVDTKTLVDIRLKVGFTYKSCHPGDYSWRHAGGGGDIIAYRLHKLQEVTEADDEADLNECIGQDVAPAWNGEGLPPVGCECEYSLNAGVTWWKCKIDYIVGTQGVVMLCDTFEGVQYVQFSSYGSALKFRPIRSEADKKREEAIMSLAKSGGAASFKYGEKFNDGSLIGAAWYELYDAIAAGKVRGVKLED